MGRGAAGTIFAWIKHALIALVARNTSPNGTRIFVFADDHFIGYAGADLADAGDGAGVRGRAADAVVDRFKYALEELLVPSVRGADVLIIAVWNGDGVEIILAARNAGKDNQSKE